MLIGGKNTNQGTTNYMKSSVGQNNKGSGSQRNVNQVSRQMAEIVNRRSGVNFSEHTSNKAPQFVQINLKLYNNFLGGTDRTPGELSQIEQAVEEYIDPENTKKQRNTTPAQIIKREIESQLKQIKELRPKAVPASMLGNFVKENASSSAAPNNTSNTL